jgi:hypothetical protein
MIRGKELPTNNMPEGHKCTVKAYTASIPDVQEVLIYGQFGVQERPLDGQQFSDPTVWPIKTVEPSISKTLANMRQWFSLPNGPKHLDCGVFIDNQGARNWVFLAYWLEPAKYQAWCQNPEVNSAWLDNSVENLEDNVGYWKEVSVILTNQMETIQQAHREHASMRFFAPEETEVHQYWGAARDRIPASATDKFDSPLGTTLPERKHVDTLGKNIKVKLPKNICHVRSAQDLMLANESHMATYINQVEPSLKDGITFIRDNPDEVGAFSSRYIREVTVNGELLNKTCGQLFFLSLAHMEKWAASHPTHVRIFAMFNKMAEQLGEDMGLALWHEVAILPEGHLHVQYVNCHNSTGFLPYFAAV